MCEVQLPCIYQPKESLEEGKSPLFTVLLLSSWQREYDKRPYRDFRFRRLEFEERMRRKYHCIRDFRVIVNYLLSRRLRSVTITGAVVSNWDAHLLKDFVRSLTSLSAIHLNLMRLPTEFFAMLCLNAKKMDVMELCLDGTPLSDEDVRLLRQFLLTSQTLRGLSVNHCSLTQYNFALIADGLYKSKRVTCFSANRLLGGYLTLDTEKIMSVMSSLLMQKRLRSLCLELCELTAQDMIPIAEHLADDKSKLQDLRLASNKIGPDGVLFLLRGTIHGGGYLELLDISSNSIGTHGGEWVAKYLSSSLMLKNLYLNNNDIEAVAINRILTARRKRCHLEGLFLYGNQFNAETARIVRRLLDAQVMLQTELDITYTYDEDLQEYRVIPWR
ncbi:hypothetical protein KR054_008988 [Drosophila jambulina]|nr:hypothetical protein KR054_008988 [Drosophila jambulina]